MRATRAQHRWADREGLLRVGVVVGCCVFGLGQLGDAKVDGQAGKDVVDIVLTAIARFARQLAVRVVFGMRPARERQKLVFEHVVELFEHEHVGQTLNELGARALGEREGGAHLPETICWQLHAAFVRAFLEQTKRLERIGGRHAARNDTVTGELARHAVLVNGIECAQNRVRRVIDGDRTQALVDFPMALKGTLREDDPAWPTLEALLGNGLSVRFLDNIEERRGMAHTRSGAHDNRRLVALRKFERRLHHVEALIRRCRVEHRHLGEVAEPTRILLGLRRDRTGVVGHEQHRAALHPHVVQAHQRVACHVQAHLLAGEQRACAAIRCAGEQLERALFVRGPLHMDALSGAGSMQLRHGFRHLGRRRPGIARNNAHPRLKCGMGERLVAHKQFLRHMFPRFKAWFQESSPVLFHVKQRGENRLDTCS